ncbi:hypothetical protein ACFV9G_23300 [Nocardioides sp. NPDC059952]|uniref:PGN_0703 family putative restriction endonuclease n=1 Tax=Nocardioides sp. NPDC059952 TaxID=3347014 RepID=UPI0036473591
MTGVDSVDDDELRAANCWFPKTDRVPGRPDITAFKQQARLRLARWREGQGHPAGSHPGRNGEPVKNGAKLRPDGPRDEDFRNFLDSADIRNAVRHRSAPETKRTEPGQQFKEDRLRYDLLSSMPMCLNLFGELHQDRERLTNVGKKLFGVEEAGLYVKFEHSPRRQSLAFTNDGTAFDVALFFGSDDGPQTVVGIETKYHEHAVREAAPDTLTAMRPAIPEHRLKMPRYREITERARDDGVFKPGWEKVVLGTSLQQIWRDHILLLAMLQYQDGARWDAGKYVLAHPARNRSFAEAGESYLQDVLANDRTFAVMTIEDLIKPGVLHPPEIASGFESRYLW